MTDQEVAFKLYHRGMLAMWVLFIIIVGGLSVWSRRTGAVPLTPTIDSWVILRFIPVMMGGVTLFSCLQFLGLSSSRLYFNIRTILIVGVCFVAYVTTGQMIAGVWKFLPQTILISEIVLLLVFAEKIDHNKLETHMRRRLPESSMSKYKPVVWPALKFGSYWLWVLFSGLAGIILLLLHEGWAVYVDSALSSATGAIIWWALATIGVLSMWHWVLIWMHNISQALYGVIRGILYIILVASLVGALYGMGVSLNALLIATPLALMSIIFSGEYESMRLWNKMHASD